MSNFRSLKYFKNKNNGKIPTGIVLNLIKNEKWRDLLNPKIKINVKQKIILKPFETLWISNN